MNAATYPPIFKPRYVRFDEKRWYAHDHFYRDGDLWLKLKRWNIAARKWDRYDALAEECGTYRRPEVRTIKGARGVAVCLVVEGRRRRFTTTIGGIYDLLCQAAGRKKLRERAAKTGRRVFL